MGNACGSVDAGESPLKETIADHEGCINCMALSDDGTIMVTGSEDCTARMWSVTTPETDCLGVFLGHASYVNAVAVVATTNEEGLVGGGVVITGSADCTIRKWCAANCECLFVYEGHNARIMKLFVTDDQIVSSSYDSTVKVWSLKTFDIPEDEESKACLRTFEGHGKGVYPMIFIPKEVLNAGVEEETNWEWENREDHDGLSGEDDEQVKSNLQDDMLITGSADMTARAWEFNTTKCLKIFIGHYGAVTTMSVDSKGKTLFTAGADSWIKSWTISTGQLIRTMDGHDGAILCMTVFNRLMYTGGADMVAKCWAKDYGDCTKTYKGHKHSIICLSLEYGNLFTGCGDGSIRAYNSTSGSLRMSFEGHEGAVNCMIILKDKMYTGSSDYTLRCWDTRELQDDALYTLYEEPAPVVVTKEPAVVAAVVEDGEKGDDCDDVDEGVVADQVEIVDETGHGDEEHLEEELELQEEEGGEGEGGDHNEAKEEEEEAEEERFDLFDDDDDDE